MQKADLAPIAWAPRPAGGTRETSHGTYPLMYIAAGRRTEQTAQSLADYVYDLGFSRAYVVSSPRASALCRKLQVVGRDRVPSVATEFEVHRLVHSARHAGADVVVGAGGGLTLDVAKVVANVAGLPMLAVPTQLSHDGFASPVAILVDGQGRKRTLGVQRPEAVFVSLPALVEAPTAAFVAGIGDLLSNEFALWDWELAEKAGREEVGREARALSSESLELIQPLLEADPAQASRDPKRLALLATALVNSGRAMCVAGTSRPASGAEHKFSHTIDSVLGSRALHGAQVAFGCLVSAYLYGADVAALERTLTRLGLPAHPGDLRMDRRELRAVLLQAARFRPERYTIFDEVGLDGSRVDTLIGELWPDL